VDARRPKALEAGLFLLVVVLPLAFTPFTTSPFADPKVVVLAAGTLLVWAGGLPLDRRLARLAALWVLVTAVASAFGVDPLRSLGASTSGNGGGLIVTGCAAYLLVAGASLPPKLAERVRGWLTWTAAIVALVMLAFRFRPELFDAAVPDLSFVGATLGNQLFASAFLAVGFAAVAGDARKTLWWRPVMLTVLALGASTAGERSSYLLPAIALVAAFWKGRVPMRRGVPILGLVLAVFVGWQLLEPLLPSGGQGAVAQFASSATDTDRFVVWDATRRGWLERPLLGWGPVNTQSAYIHAASPADLAEATRRWNDAHDLFLETAVTSGVLGLGALLWLTWTVLKRALRVPPRLGWAFGAAAALAAYAAVEPYNLVLTPMLFLFAGIACGAAADVVTSSSRRSSALVGTALAAGLALAVLLLTASTLEEWGERYSEAWAFRAALAIQPWRLSAQEGLAFHLAIDARAGDDRAAAEARSTIQSAVRRHPWDVDVRLQAADVELLLKDPEAAHGWAARQIARFPADGPAIRELLEGSSEPQTALGPNP
jgi:hypothetical protein